MIVPVKSVSFVISHTCFLKISALLQLITALTMPQTGTALSAIKNSALVQLIIAVLT